MFYDREEEKAWKEIIEEMKPFVWSVINNIAEEASTEDKYDLYQECCIHIWNDLYEKYDKDKAKFSTYVCHCCGNLVKRKYHGVIKRGIVRRHQANQIFAQDYWNDQGRFIYRDMDRPWLSETENDLQALMEYLEGNPNPLRLKGDNDFLYAMLEHYDETQGRIADIMGYSHPSAVGMKKVRFIERIRYEIGGKSLKQSFQR